MSDHWIVVIPRDPHATPQRDRVERALTYLRAIAPDADAITQHWSERPQFYDCGANFERIVCPQCDQSIDEAWWHNHMDADFRDQGFQLALFQVPCCMTVWSLDRLRYYWTQGFAKFAIECMNPNIGPLPDDYLREVESILELPMMVIYRHL